MKEELLTLILATSTDYNLSPPNFKSVSLEEITGMIDLFNSLFYPTGNGLTYIVGEHTRRILRFRIDYRSYDWEPEMGVFV